MGTGTTAIGALKLGKNLKYIGSEISEKQCEYANMRILKHNQQRTFDFWSDNNVDKSTDV